MAVSLDNIDNPQEMEVVVSGPGKANRLFIFTGTAVFTFKGTSNDWSRNTISFLIPDHKFSPGQFLRGIATASLASISNNSVAQNAGWAVDSVDADWDDESGLIEVRAKLAARDTDGFINRMAYQVTVLAAL